MSRPRNYMVDVERSLLSVLIETAILAAIVCAINHLTTHKLGYFAHDGEDGPAESRWALSRISDNHSASSTRPSASFRSADDSFSPRSCRSSTSRRRSSTPSGNRKSSLPAGISISITTANFKSPIGSSLLNCSRESLSCQQSPINDSSFIGSRWNRRAAVFREARKTYLIYD